MRKLVEGKKVIVAVVAMILITATVGIGVYDFTVKAGSLTIDGKSEQVKTNTKTVGELLKEKEIKVGEDDKLTPKADKELEEGFKISIVRAVPAVLTVAGESNEIMTAEATVADVLSSKGVEYSELDRITPALESEVTPHMEIEVVKVTESNKTVEEAIAFETETRENGDIAKGETKTVQEGAEGLKEIEVKEVYENGELVSSETVSEKVVKEPVNKIVEKGTKEAVTVSRSSASRANSASSGASVSGNGMVFNASAYGAGAEENGGYAGITALGTKLRPGVVAVDPNVIPLGSRVYIEYMDGTPWGYGIAEDTGGAIKGNKIDIFMESGIAQFGRRNMRVYIVN